MSTQPPAPTPVRKRTPELIGPLSVCFSPSAPAPPSVPPGKQTGVDRKLKKVIDSRYTEEPAQPQPHEGSPDLLPPPSPVSPELGPSPLETIVSPFGPLYESTSRKTLVYLLGTLNASYDDYDFRLVWT